MCGAKARSEISLARTSNTRLRQTVSGLRGKRDLFLIVATRYWFSLDLRMNQYVPPASIASGPFFRDNPRGASVN